MEILNCCLISLVESVLLIFPGILVKSGGDANPCSFSQEAQRFPEVNALFFHNEGQDVTTGTAGAEAVPALLLRIDKEGGGLLTVKWAQCPEGPPGLLQVRILADNLNDVCFLFYFVNNGHIITIILRIVVLPHSPSL